MICELGGIEPAGSPQSHHPPVEAAYQPGARDGLHVAGGGRRLGRGKHGHSQGMFAAGFQGGCHRQHFLAGSAVCGGDVDDDGPVGG
ncbi:Uncharacterised protein [Mycobacterium tuberculosis]|uniref:Uncharacterized protein n=1 Tax=Mycobacterium tuberculosis TaxID=1773 RepID=A0A655ALW4_MYCTX|nr:Uncharacterised protein [Mycobacterium tuberculosis]CKS91254.1 Uncharacterised protein [Mycobacterium tuberculosis]CKT65786.1 Uncharacterised protein [Mycobacterium tuberculosis]CKY04767.1 Uncharacterised protein [Mycobacterium tuberculosis]CMQ45754.1 Uncharacterised protein [Mycobacterium tuberculosis]